MASAPPPAWFMRGRLQLVRNLRDDGGDGGARVVQRHDMRFIGLRGECIKELRSDERVRGYYRDEAVVDGHRRRQHAVQHVNGLPRSVFAEDHFARHPGS